MPRRRLLVHNSTLLLLLWFVFVDRGFFGQLGSVFCWSVFVHSLKMRIPGFLIGRVLDFLENSHTVCEVVCLPSPSTT